MGLGGISLWKLVIILTVVILLFGTKRLSGLGEAIRGFKKAIKDESKENPRSDSLSDGH